MEYTKWSILVATGVGGSSKAGSEEEVEFTEEREEPAEEAEATEAVVVEVTEPVKMATTLPLLLPSHIGDPDCPCVDLQLCTPMFEQAEEEEAEHSSICAKAASVPSMLKKEEDKPFPEFDDASGEQLLVHMDRLGARPVG